MNKRIIVSRCWRYNAAISMEADSWFQYLSQKTMLRDSPASPDMAWVFLQPHTTGSTGSNRRQLLLSAHMRLFVYVIAFLFICLCVVCMHIMCMFAHVWEQHCVRTHIYVCAYGDLWLMLEIFPNCSSTLFNKVGPLNEPRTHWWSSSH